MTGQTTPPENKQQCGQLSLLITSYDWLRFRNASPSYAVLASCVGGMIILYICKTTLFCISKHAMTTGQYIHSYETRGRGNYRTGRHRTVVNEHLIHRQVIEVGLSYSALFKVVFTL
ncbi:hypothetical protein J6590_029267 [Homalodisca vitripennis]|nr:hypothetical protein J6590_029267 [Homalodisca vitripennis]